MVLSPACPGSAPTRRVFDASQPRKVALTQPRGLEYACALVIATLLFAFLGTRGLNEPDEGRYAEVAREMSLSDDWLTPRLNGIGHFQKPPLIYWSTVLGMRLLGTNEWGARLPSTLAALGTTWLTFVIARTLFDRATALMAACILVSSLEFFWLARLLTPDMLLTFWITASIASLVIFARGGGQRRWRWGFFAFMGLGLLTKGPMALVVPLSAALGWQLGTRRRGEDLPFEWGAGLALTLGIGASWFVAMCLAHPELTRYFVVSEFLERVGTHIHGHARPIWFFVPVLLAGLFPWSMFVPAMSASLWRRLRAAAPIPSRHWLLFGWTGPPFVLLSLSGSKLLTYVLPLFPAIAITLAVWWQTHAGSWATRCTLAATAVAFFAVAIAVWAAPAVLEDGAGIDVSLAFKLLSVGVACAIAAGLWAVDASGGRQMAVFVLSGGSAILWLGSSYEAGHLNDALGMQASVRPLIEVLEARPDVGRARMFKCGVHANGLEFYLSRLVSTTAADADVVLAPERVGLLASRDDCEPAFRALRPSYGLVRSHRFAQSFAPFHWRVLARAGDFLLITNPGAMPDTDDNAADWMPSGTITPGGANTGS